jgi:fructose-1-phosphate kinase PfkB-like protein
MLLTITPNPAIDRTLYVPRMTVGAVHRAEQVEWVAGGKGLNVTRAARTLGSDVLATGPLGGYTGKMFADLARVEGLPTDWYWLASEETRNCLLVTHDVGDTTLINEPGPMVSSEDWLECLAHIRRLAGRSQAVAFAGSLPPGIDTEAFTKLACSLSTEERPIYLDTSGQALAAALAQPDGLCIKENWPQVYKCLS